MRSLKRNKQTLYYATFHDKTVVYELNEDGSIKYIDIDGEQVPVEISTSNAGYSAPIKYSANISAGKGESDASVFGINLDYTRSISTSDKNLSITNTSLIWIETVPLLNTDGSANPDSSDYTVALTAPSLNALSIAIKARKKNG